MITAISFSSHKEGNFSATTILVAYADHKVFEYDARSGTITKFGALLSSIVHRAKRNYVITGVSLINDGRVLCLNDDVSITYIKKKSIMNFNWNSLSQKKIKLDGSAELVNGQIVDQPTTNAQNLDEKEMTNGTNGTNSWKSGRKRANRYYGGKADPYEFIWNKLAKTVDKEDSFIACLGEIKDGALASVEITKNTIDESLPKPFTFKQSGER